MKLTALASILILVASANCFAVVRRPQLARKAYERAVDLQQKLEAKPAKSRTTVEYRRVIREYRNVYLWDFASVKAPVAAEAMGDLYAEMGNLFSNPAYFRAAVKAYEFVVAQYPTCSMARDSWLSMGKVYLDGLNDPDQAADTFRAFLKKHPSSARSKEARKGLKEIAKRAAAEKQAKSSNVESADASDIRAAVKTVSDSQASAIAGSDHGATGRPVEVTEIHHWTGPNYTRVVIGAKGPFKYDTLRLSNPDRIVFDLPNTHLERSLLKKDVAVNEDFLRDIRVGQFKPNVVRVVLDVKDIKDYSAFPLPNPFRLIIDVHGSSPRIAKNAPEQPAPASRPSTKTAPGIVAQASARENTPTVKPVSAISTTQPEVEAAKRIQEAAKQKAETASNHPVPQPTKPKSKAASNHPPRPAVKQKTQVASVQTEHHPAPVSTKPASPTEDGSQTLTRALGLKVARIVIDPGHGGFDTGTIGPTGLKEKNVVLDVALRLRKLLETRTDSQVFMTRTTDKFIPLEERTAIANEKDADLFISIHANASRSRRVRGIETYFLNFTSDPDALNVAARENATSQESVHQLQDLIKKIALNNKIEESQELARDIQTVLYKRMSRVSRGIHNRGVRKAPFVVLIGANMPSILAEISFLSNPHTEHLLRRSSYREDIAKALFNGIEEYVNNLGSVRMAQSTR